MQKDNYAAWEERQYTRETFAQLSTYERLRHFVLLGHLAASAHNTQPWRFSIDEEKNVIHCSIDRSYILPASDKDGRQTVISLGCAIGNMSIGALHFGYEPQVTIFENNQDIVKPLEAGDTQKIVPIADINFIYNASTKEEEVYYTSIFVRKVIRTEYDLDQRLPESYIESLEHMCQNTKVKLHSITDTIRRISIAEFQGQADNFVINSKKFSRELGEWLVPNDTDGYLGMPGSGFGLDQEQSTRLHEALLGMRPLEAEDGLRFSTGGKRGFEKSPYIGFITGENDDIQNWIDTGICFQKIFVDLTAKGYALAVHAGVVEVALINKMFAVTLGTTRKILMLFRAGKIKKEEDMHRPHSPRLPLSHIIIDK
ncbi:MAG: hypothetical protein WCW16_04985 [Candidatus Magasanikbacteria bacterium]